MSDGSVSTRFSVEDGASGPLDDIAVEAERVAAELEQAEAAAAAANAVLREQKRAAEDAAFALKELSLSGKATKEQIAAAKAAVLEASKALSSSRRAAEDANAGLKAVQAQAKGVAIDLMNAGKSAQTIAPQIAEVGEVAVKTGAGTKELAQRSGDLDTSLKALAGAIGIVSPEMQRLLMDSGDVLGAFEGLHKGSEALGVGLGGVGSALGALSVAVAAAVTVYSQFAVEQERAADASGRAAERLKEVQRVGALAEETLRKLSTSGSAFTGILEDIADRSRVAAGELQSVIDAENAVGRVRAAASPELQALGTLQASLSAQSAAAQQAFQAAGASGDQEAIDKARAEVQQVSAALAQVTSDLEAQRAAVERAIDTEEMLREKAQLEAELRDQEAEAIRKGTEAARSRAEADRKAEQEAAKLAAQQAARFAENAALTEAQQRLALEAYNVTQAIAALDPALSDAERAYRAQTKQIDDLAASLGQAALAGDLLPEEFDRLTKLIADIREQAAADLEAAQQAVAEPATAPEATQTGGADRSDKLGAAVGGAVSGSLSQTLAPLLDALGPKGMIVSVILGILEQGPEAVKAILLGVPKIIGDLVGTVLDLIPQLPTILTDVVMGVVKVLPDLLLAVFSLVYGPFAVELTIALVRLIPMLVKELTIGLAQLAFQLPSILFDTAGAFGVLLRELRDLPRVLVRQATRELIPALVDGIAKAFRQIVRDAVRTFSLDGRRDRRSGGTDDGRRLVDILDRQRARRSRRASG